MIESKQYMNGSHISVWPWMIFRGKTQELIQQ